MKRANEWSREKLLSWGLTNGHLEAWGPFGRGWELKRFSAQLIEPQAIPLKAYPNAWTPGFDKTLEAKVIYLDARTDADLEKYHGELKGAIVLASPIRPVATRMEPMASRYNDQLMLTVANGTSGDFDVLSGRISGGRRGGAFTPPAARGGTNAAVTRGGTNAAAAGGRRGGGGAGRLPFLAREGVALVVNPSGQGDSGTIFVASATVPPPDASGTNAPPAGAGGRGARGTPAYSTNAPAMPAQITVAAEDYNRLVRMAQAGEPMKMAVELQVKYHYEDPMAYNTVAEIPGTDLKDELVMLGGHMDSWHSGTGATDNGAGVAAAMEAVRIIKALNLKPRRTIRIALWSGEEQGLMGSRAYVSSHFGYFTNSAAATNSSAGASAGDQGTGGRRGGRGGGGAQRLVKGDEYNQLSAYFNLDNGGGKIRGIFMQGNESVRPIFRQWMEPFRELGADTLALIGTGGTDHLSFDGIGLPGFQFIQDPMDYATRTHHSNEDVFDRIQEDDMKQASTILAAFVYEAAMRDEKLPRKADQ
jgi:hypothetical protein